MVVPLCERLCLNSPYPLVFPNTQNHLHCKITVAYTLVILPMAQWPKIRHQGTAGPELSNEEVSSTVLAVTNCHHISLGLTDRTITILCCGLLSKKEKSNTNRVVFDLISKKLRLKGTFAACLLLKAQCTSYWGSYTSLTSVPNQTLRKNKKVITINSLQLVMLKILLYVLSSSCASAIAGFPHSKNNITVCLHVKHSNSAMLP